MPSDDFALWRLPFFSSLRASLRGLTAPEVSGTDTKTASVPRVRWFYRFSKRQMRAGLAALAVVVLVLAVVTGVALSSLHRQQDYANHQSAKLEHVYINPIVKRILAVNQHNNEITANTELLREIVRHAADSCYRVGCDPDILLGVFRTESDFRPGVKNKKTTARGLGQTLAFWQDELAADRICTMPSGLADPYGVGLEIQDSAMVLVHYKAIAKGDYIKTLWGYYAGPKHVHNPDDESRGYSTRVMGNVVRI